MFFERSVMDAFSVLGGDRWQGRVKQFVKEDKVQHLTGDPILLELWIEDGMDGDEILFVPEAAKHDRSFEPSSLVLTKLHINSKHGVANRFRCPMKIMGNDLFFQIVKQRLSY